MKTIFTFVLVLSGLFASSQQRESESELPSREADVTFNKRVWRVIDLRDRPNKSAASVSNPLSLILFNAVKEGKLIPYLSDSLKTRIPLSKFLKQINDTIIEENYKDINDPSSVSYDTVISEFNPLKKIQKYIVMEEWLFNKKSSNMMIKIIAIAPLYRKIHYDNDVGIRQLCWLKYQDNKGVETTCKEILSENHLYTSKNKITDSTYFDWFEKRMFFSYIIKISSSHDMSLSSIAEFKDNRLEAMMQSERLKQELQDYQDDMWDK